jgi:hypothetical protein
MWKSSFKIGLLSQVSKGGSTCFSRCLRCPAGMQYSVALFCVRQGFVRVFGVFEAAQSGLLRVAVVRVLG